MPSLKSYQSHRIALPIAAIVTIFVLAAVGYKAYYQSLNAQKKITQDQAYRASLNEAVAKRYIDIELPQESEKKLEKYLKHQPVKRKWVSCNINLNGEIHAAKVKYHGTSLAHFLNGKFSYAIKLKKDSTNYIDQARKFKLIKSEEADPSLIVINKMAQNMGLISTAGEMKILRINGQEQGIYYLVEDIKKEYLEREHGITNYSTLVNVSDWDRKENISTGVNHISDNDLYFGHIEMKNDLHFAKALHQYRIFSDFIKQKDITGIKSMIDQDYMSRFLALATLYNDIHFLTGDNLKLVYDFNRGQFYPIYRAESEGRDINIKWSVTFPNFNKFLFHSLGDAYAASVNTKLFKYLLTDNAIRNQRDQYLYSFIKQQHNIESTIDSIYAKEEPVMRYRDSTWLAFEPKKDRQIGIVRSVLKQANDHINYAQIYVTYDSSLNTLHCLLDAFAPIDIICDSINLHLPKVNGIQFDTQLNPIYLNPKFKVNAKHFNPKYLIFVNSITGDTIPKQSIYLNYIDQSGLSVLETTENQLKANRIAYRLYGDSLVILPGTYTIKSDLNIHSVNTTCIEKGVNFKMNPGVNVCINGSITFNGTASRGITIKNAIPNQPYGTFAILGQDATSYANIQYLSVSGGSESYFGGRLYTGQFAIYHTQANISHSSFTNSRGDDGLNAKYCKITIDQCRFENNYADQVDLDFCFGLVRHAQFKPSMIDPNGDGLDLSGSYVQIQNCVFSKFIDKGLSLGEKSRVLVYDNQFEGNTNAIAVKDQTKLWLWENDFSTNQYDVFAYIKKPIFKAPELNIQNHEIPLKLNILSGQRKAATDFEIAFEKKRFKQLFDEYRLTIGLSDKMRLNRLIED